MQRQRTIDDPLPPATDDILSRIPGAADAAERIRDETTRNALRELLRTAVGLKLHPQRIDLGKETGFGFGPKRYPLCRINAAKGIAFHGDRRVNALIIRNANDHAFRLATGVLRRLALALALDG